MESAPGSPALCPRSTQPIFKWPGGKRALAEQILPLMPRRFGKYYEPFVGGAAIFLALRPGRAVLSDSNEELINAYVQIRDRPEQVVRLLSRMKNSEPEYYAIRASRPSGPVAQAARLIYLTTLSFNGIHRVNLRGEFNVPYGWKAHLNPCDRERIAALSKALVTADLRAADFQEATSRAKAGDLVYFDPPYTVAHGLNGFLKYNEKIFSWADQVRLSEHARVLMERGVQVVISNADHQSTRRLYRGLAIHKLERFSRVAASAQHRSRISELLVVGKAK